MREFQKHVLTIFAEIQRQKYHVFWKVTWDQIIYFFPTYLALTFSMPQLLSMKNSNSISLPYSNIWSGTIRWQGRNILDTNLQPMLTSFFYSSPNMSPIYSRHQNNNIVESCLLTWGQNSSYFVKILTWLTILICWACTLHVSSRTKTTDDDRVHNSKVNTQESAPTGVN